MADGDQLLGVNINQVQQQQPAEGTPGVDTTPDYLDILVGDGKKYADNGNLAKGYANLVAHNSTIKEEKDAMKLELDALKAQHKTVDSVMAAIKQGGPAANAADDLGQQQQAAATQGLSKEDIVALVTGTLDKRDEEAETKNQVTQIEANQQKTWEDLSKVYGDQTKAIAAVALYVNGDKQNTEMVQKLGSYDPATLVQIITTAVPAKKGENVDFGLADKGVNHPKENEVPVPQGLFTYAQAEAVRKGNRKLYNSRDFQLRLHKSAAMLGDDKFWAGTKRRK